MKIKTELKIKIKINMKIKIKIKKTLSSVQRQTINFQF